MSAPISMRLGATLYNLVTGRDPLESVARMAGEHQETAYRLNPQVPLIVSDVIERALALEPGDAFPDRQGISDGFENCPIDRGSRSRGEEPGDDAGGAGRGRSDQPGAGDERPGRWRTESISQPTSVSRPPSRPPSAPVLKAPAAGRRQQQRCAKPKAKRNWLIIGIGGVVILALCIGASALLASLVFRDGGGSENATLTYEAGLRQSVQETTTKLAAQSTSPVTDPAYAIRW